MPSFTPAQQNAFAIAERTSSVFSILGVTVILGSFIAYPQLRKSVHRLIFYAAWGNGLYIISTMIAMSGVYSGDTSALCTFQAFGITMFQLSDVMWNFAIAVNVYLTVFRNCDQSYLRSLEWKYFVINYGIPFIIAFALCFSSNQELGRVYGNAGIWCTIRTEWNVLRMSLHYGPVWAMMLASFGIYVAAGISLYRRDKQLHQFASRSQTGNEKPTADPMITVLDVMGNPQAENFKVTEIHITSEAADQVDCDDVDHIGSHPRKASRMSGDNSPDRSAIELAPLPQVKQRDGNRPPPTYKPYSITVATDPSQLSGRVAELKAPARRDRHYASWTYTKYSALFFLAMLVTWGPASVNRVYGLVYPTTPSWALNMAGATVLPLMGFCNMVVFVATSWSTVRVLLYRGSRRTMARIVSPTINSRTPARLESNSSIENLRDGNSIDPSIGEHRGRDEPERGV